MIMDVSKVVTENDQAEELLNQLHDSFALRHSTKDGVGVLEVYRYNFSGIRLRHAVEYHSTHGDHQQGRVLPLAAELLPSTCSRLSPSRIGRLGVRRPRRSG